MIDAFGSLLYGRSRTQHVLHESNVFLHESIPVREDVQSQQDRPTITSLRAVARVPIVVQPNRDHVTILPILQRL